MIDISSDICHVINCFHGEVPPVTLGENFLESFLDPWFDNETSFDLW